jgi:hypothetical protein
MSLKINGGKKYEKKRKGFSASAAVLTVSSVPGTVMAADGVKPQDGTTKEQPFWSGTGGSTRFRIPCLVSLDDGTLVAGCDARWNTSLDGGGLDTIVRQTKERHGTIRLLITLVITGTRIITILQRLSILPWQRTEKRCT